jgi:hypothetical protein
LEEFLQGRIDGYIPDFHFVFSNAGNTVAEDAPLGAKVGVLSAQDEDADQTLKFTVENSDKVPFGSKGNDLVVDGTLDYELASTVSVKIIATDDGVPPLSVSRFVFATSAIG